VIPIRRGWRKVAKVLGLLGAIKDGALPYQRSWKQWELGALVAFYFTIHTNFRQLLGDEKRSL